MKDYKGRKALIIGLARTGLAAARLLDRLGAQTAVTDMKDASALREFEEKLPPATKRMLGGHDGVTISDYDLVVISPGVPWDSPLAEAAREAGIELISEIELAFSLLSAPVIAVTGSNGKSTTTSLIGRMMERGGEKVYVGGNIGAPLADAVGEDYEWIVAEVSSFQLEGVKTFRPRVALILNITPDHIDRHKTMAVYAALKKRLCENQKEGDTLILNAADPLLDDVSAPSGVAVRYFSRDALAGEGAWIEDDAAVAVSGGRKIRLFGLGDLRIQGTHNIENALAASLAALAAGVAPSAIKEAVSSFAGLPHRMERVAEINGIVYINDSKGTNVDATVMSLAGFKKDVVLIAGGSSKGADFAPLAEAIWRGAKGVVLIGQTAPEIEKALGMYQPKARAKDMNEAVKLASAWLLPGETVLLSPACASFDMFKNYEDRGEAFRAAVAALAKEGGQCL